MKPFNDVWFWLGVTSYISFVITLWFLRSSVRDNQRLLKIIESYKEIARRYNSLVKEYENKKGS